ncbi:MAG: hypothetical protein ABSC13_03785 [Dehalococcoidia bacterium]
MEQALQSTGNVTHLVMDDRRGISVEVWLDPANQRARADSTTTAALITEGYDPRPAGYRISEIIANGRTYDEIPSLSSANTPDESLSLALPWFVSSDKADTPAVQYSTVTRGRAGGKDVLTVNEVADAGIDVPFAVWPTDSPFLCPLQRTLTVDASSYLPVSLDVTLLCQQERYPTDYEYQIIYSSIEFLDEGTLPDAQFSPEAVRDSIIGEELAALKASPFDVYWLGSVLPASLKINGDDGLSDARANWPSQDGEVAYFDYSPVHSSPGGLGIYEWPKGDEGLFCTTEWPVSGTAEVVTRFGPALFCDAQEQQLVFTIGNTMVRLEYGLNNGPQWFIDRANALVPLK